MNYSALIVDDEENTRLYLGELLKRYFPHIQYDYAPNAMEAFACMNKQTYDLLFLDIVMPDIDGITFFEILKKSGSAPFVCIISAHPDFEYARHAMQLGAFDYLLKPISRSSLQKSMERFEAGHQHAKQDATPKKEPANRQDETTQINLPYIGGCRLVCVRDIIIVEFVERNKVNIFLADGEHINYVHLSLKRIEELLPDYFVKVNRRSLINQKAIHSFNPKQRTVLLKSENAEYEWLCSRTAIKRLRLSGRGAWPND